MASDFPRGLLRPTEQVLWRGAPARGVRLVARDIFLVPFSILWCGFAIFWEVTAARAGGDWFFLLFGAVFVAIGLTIALGRLVIDAWLRARTRYALTDKRVLIERDAPFGSFVSVELASIGELKLVQERGGRGTIWLGPQPSLSARGNGFDIWIGSLSPTPQLMAIENARGVLDRILNAQERSRAG